jgi:hypothetical protein
LYDGQTKRSFAEAKQILANAGENKNYSFEIVSQWGAIWGPTTHADKEHFEKLLRLNRSLSQKEKDDASYQDAYAYLKKSLPQNEEKMIYCSTLSASPITFRTLTHLRIVGSEHAIATSAPAVTLPLQGARDAMLGPFVECSARTAVTALDDPANALPRRGECSHHVGKSL